MLDQRSFIRATQLDVGIARYGRPRVRAIINGFARSGTTWVLESMAKAAGAKTILEPLCPASDAAKDVLTQLGIVGHSLQHLCMPGPRFGSDPMMLAYLDQSVYGRTWSNFQRGCRSSVLASMRRQIIVKDVRFHNMLSILSRRYCAPVVHIRRHPCAVIYSLSRTNWDWTLDDLTLPRLFEVFLSGGCDEVRHRAEFAIREFDGDVLSRIAAYWAVGEWVVEQEVARTSVGKIVWYEDLIENPQRSIRELCLYCALPSKRSFDFETDSVSTSEVSKGINPAKRGDAWRSRMADADIKKIIRIAKEVAPEVSGSL